MTTKIIKVHDDSDQVCGSPRILADLREAGFLLSTRGKMGGYRLARAPQLISLGEIIRVIEELCARGMSLLVISSELEELSGYAHRVLVLRDRAQVAELVGDLEALVQAGQRDGNVWGGHRDGSSGSTSDGSTRATMPM